MRSSFMMAMLVVGATSSVNGEDKKIEPQKEANLLINGGFEEGPAFIDGFMALDPGSQVMTGWTVTRGQIDLIGTHWIAGEGGRSLDLNGSPGFGGVKQSFKTVSGQRYRLTFLMAGSPGSGQTTNTLCVRAAAKKEVFSFDNEGKTGKEMGWAKRSWEFVAFSEETTLEIHTLDDESGYAGPALDDVRVVTVTEPQVKSETPVVATELEAARITIPEVTTIVQPRNTRLFARWRTR